MVFKKSMESNLRHKGKWLVIDCKCEVCAETFHRLQDEYVCMYSYTG